MVIIAGPPFAGKSRLALEATQGRQEVVVVAVDPHSTPVPKYRHLLGARSDVIVLVEDPPSEQLDGLLGLATSEPRLKLIVTTATPAAVPNPSFGSDERVRVITLAGLDDAQATELLRSTGEPLDPTVAGWIVEQSGGLPGILLTAAAIGQRLHVVDGGFRGQVGSEIERRAPDVNYRWTRIASSRIVTRPARAG